MEGFAEFVMYMTGFVKTLVPITHIQFCNFSDL